MSDVVHRLRIAVLGGWMACAGCSADAPGPLQGEPAAAGPWELVQSQPDRSQLAHGFVLLSHFDATESALVILDGEARPVWSHAGPGEPHKITRVQPDGDTVLYSTYDRDRLQDLGTIWRVSMDHEVLSQTRAVAQHHDFAVHDDGSFAWLSWDFLDMSFGVGDIALAADVVRTAPEGSDLEAPTRLFSFLDDYPQSPYWTCGHMAADTFVPGYSEWTHSNSLVYEPTDDAYYVLARYWDAVLKLDRSTGALLWQLGGKYGDFAVDDGTAFHHGHMSQVWPGGMLVFDNADHTGQPSGVVEYAWDEANRTVEKVWEYRDPQGRFVSHLGDARRLDNGNTLISWGPLGVLTEVTPEGEIVWEVRTPDKVGRVSFLDALPQRGR